MYIPSHFQQTDRAEIAEFIRRFSFGTLISQEVNRPVATHLPFVLHDSSDSWVLSSHFAKANPQSQTIEGQTVLAIFSEPHAYISPSLYDKKESVPTWNYMAVHVYGKMQLISEPTEVRSLLESMISTYEPSYQVHWQDLSEDFKTKMSKGITAFHIQVTDIQAKEKLSQNKTQNEQSRIADFLTKNDSEVARQIGDRMNQKMKA